MYDEHIEDDEFDLVFELICAVLFMIVGVFGISTMVRQLNTQTEVTSRVDKINISSIDQEEMYPFYFTGYQAYMFAWMMDGHDDTAILWSNCRPHSNLPEETTSSSYGENYILLDPANEAAGFIVKRNRAIVGADEYSIGSVKSVLANSVSNSHNLWKVYAGRPFNEDSPINYWYLDLTDKHTERKVVIKDSEGNTIEERIDYIWTLHPRTSAGP